jgi:tryptophan synthase alpha chain
MNTRINKIFSKNTKKLITFVTGGDPDLSTSKEIIFEIIKSDADIIEIGMPFSDPMADGPTIQLSSNRAIKNNINLDSIFDICLEIRKTNENIPIILMGYYNVILHFGIKEFVKKCSLIGIDGLIIVDLQPEEDGELFEEMKNAHIDLIRLITPNTTDSRIKIITKNASGFLYYVTVTGITGQESADMNDLKNSIKKIKKFTTLPIVAGFGIKNKSHVNQICKITEGAVVGSSIIKIIEDNMNNKNKMLKLINKFVKDLKNGTKI